MIESQNAHIISLLIRNNRLTPHSTESEPKKITPEVGVSITSGQNMGCPSVLPRSQIGMKLSGWTYQGSRLGRVSRILPGNDQNQF